MTPVVSSALTCGFAMAPAGGGERLRKAVNKPRVGLAGYPFTFPEANVKSSEIFFTGSFPTCSSGSPSGIASRTEIRRVGMTGDPSGVLDRVGAQ
jgi:hypothetical protein